MSILNQQRCLVLNSAWCIIGTKTVQEAFSDLSSGAWVALDIQDDYMVPVKWDQWINLEVRDQDDSIGTPRGRIRVPRVMIALNYKKVPVKRKKCNMRNLRERYNDTCALTGKKLKPSEMSREHVVPISKGGRNGWENEVLAHKDINSKRGDRPYEDLGLSRPKILPEPKPTPVAQTIKNTHALPEWEMFLAKQ